MCNNIKKLSSRYNVKRLGKEDAELIYEMTRKNELYYKYCGRQNTIENIYNDFENVPPSKDINELYHIGYFEKDELVAILILLDKFPDDETAYIGFFMMNIDYQGKGIGSKIIKDLSECLIKQGYKNIQLGIDKDNPQSRHFWKKNGFKEIREVKQELGVVIAAKKNL